MPSSRTPRAAAGAERRRQTASGRRPTSAERRRRARAARRARLLVLGALAAVVVVVVLALTAFGGRPASEAAPQPQAAARLPAAGPPRPQVVALQGSLRLQLPIQQSRVTAIGYHAASDGALALEPFGKQANAGLVSRVFHGLFGGGGGGLRWYQLPGGHGAPTATLDVGAAPGTDVYSPVDGTVVGLTDLVLDGHVYGKRIDVQPAGAPSVVVSLSGLRPDPALSVGSSLASGTSKVGTIVDVSHAERQALAAHTHDEGDHVSVEVRAAATVPLS